MSDESRMRLIWPEPKFTPTPGGSTLNPERVNGLYEALRAEMTLGEQVSLCRMLISGIADVVGEGETGDEEG